MQLQPLVWKKKLAFVAKTQQIRHKGAVGGARMWNTSHFLCSLFFNFSRINDLTRESAAFQDLDALSRAASEDERKSVLARVAMEVNSQYQAGAAAR
jgi:hypothetical protein